MRYKIFNMIAVEIKKLPDVWIEFDLLPSGIYAILRIGKKAYISSTGKNNKTQALDDLMEKIKKNGLEIELKGSRK